jgi:hypothetical protein
VQDATIDPGDNKLAFNAGVALTATLKGGVNLGVFGGIPHIFTVSGGLQADVVLSAKAMSALRGQAVLPTEADKDGHGSVAFDFSIRNNEGTGPADITANVGLYLKFDFLGVFTKTLEHTLGSLPVAQLDGYGLLMIDVPPSTAPGSKGEHVRTVPDGNFPSYSLGMHQKLKEKVEEYKKASLDHEIEESQKALKGTLFRMEAIELRKFQEAELKQSSADEDVRDRERKALEANHKQALDAATATWVEAKKALTAAEKAGKTGAELTPLQDAVRSSERDVQRYQAYFTGSPDLYHTSLVSRRTSANFDEHLTAESAKAERALAKQWEDNCKLYADREMGQTQRIRAKLKADRAAKEIEEQLRVVESKPAGTDEQKFRRDSEKGFWTRRRTENAAEVERLTRAVAEGAAQLAAIPLDQLSPPHRLILKRGIAPSLDAMLKRNQELTNELLKKKEAAVVKRRLAETRLEDAQRTSSGIKAAEDALAACNAEYDEATTEHAIRQASVDSMAEVIAGDGS